MSKKAMNEMINGLRSECQSLEAANELLRAKIIELTAAYSKELDELAQRNYQLRVNGNETRATAIEDAVSYLANAIPDQSYESVVFNDNGYVYLSTRYLREHAERIRQRSE